VAAPRFTDADRRQIGDAAADLLARMRRHGGGPDGSVTRLLYTPAWQAGMEELERWFRDAGLEVRVDAVGSRFGRLPGPDGREGVVLSGSHVDSVVCGGAYDGILGVVMAACAVRWLREQAGAPSRTLEVFANCEEESSRFAGNFWGSRALTGKIPPEDLERLKDPDGVTIAQAMRDCGLDPERVPEAQRTDLAAYVEPHIEQGPVLEGSGEDVAVVEGIVNVRVLNVSFEGVAGHAGGMPMSYRHDALAGAAEIALGAERLAREKGAPAVATVGSMEVWPGGFNQVPGLARFTVDFRHPEESVVDGMEEALRGLLDEVAERRGLTLGVSQRVRQAGMRFDERICALLEAACVDAGVRWRRMASSAGHDAQVIGKVCPAAMLFVPSKGGHSHRPDEETELPHIVSGIQILAQTLFALAYQERSPS
jgi:allantoate deiminase